MTEYKTIKCYCGGTVVWRKKVDRRRKTGWRWELWNCFPDWKGK